MNGFGRERVLIASDGTEQSLQTIKYASLILDPKRFEIVLFHVLTKVPESFIDLEKIPAYRYKIVSVDAWEERQELLIKEFMEKAKALLLAAGFPNESITLKIDDRKIGIARDIAAESQEGYKALVVGRKGVSEFKDFMLGSVASKVVELVPIPLWVVGGRRRPRKLLACLDNSDGAMLAVDHIADILDSSGNCEITLFHAVRGFRGFRNFVREFFSSEADKTAVEEIENELSRAAKLLEPSFDKAKAALISQGVVPERIHQKITPGAGSPAMAIMEEAKSGGYDTIIVGRRGLSRVEEFMMGRVSSKIINMAKDKTVWVVS